MNFFSKLILMLTATILTGCSSSGIDPSLQQEIDYKSYSTEELFDYYEDLNDDLVDIIEDKDYYYKKLIKAKNEYRSISQRINSRQKRISSIESPEIKEGAPEPVINEDKIEDYREQITDLEEELAEVQEEMDEYSNLTKELTAKAIQLRINRNKAFDAYIASREELKALNKKAAKN